MNEMHHREITLADGRYMIFYTFDEAAALEAGAGPASESPDVDRVPSAAPPADAGSSDKAKKDTDV
jgi:hypothetical protein